MLPSPAPYFGPKRMPNPYSIPPAAIEGLLEAYERDPDALDVPSLLILARMFERMGCDQQALDCADRAARLDPESKPEAVAVARKCIGRTSGVC